MIAQYALEEAVGHLGAAIMQSLPSDDQIIMDHVKAAHAILTVVSRAQRAMTPAVTFRCPICAETAVADRDLDGSPICPKC